MLNGSLEVLLDWHSMKSVMPSSSHQFLQDPFNIDCHFVCDEWDGENLNWNIKVINADVIQMNEWKWWFYFWCMCACVWYIYIICIMHIQLEHNILFYRNLCWKKVFIIYMASWLYLFLCLLWVYCTVWIRFTLCVRCFSQATQDILIDIYARFFSTPDWFSTINVWLWQPHVTTVQEWIYVCVYACVRMWVELNFLID